MFSWAPVQAIVEQFWQVTVALDHAPLRRHWIDDGLGPKPSGASWQVTRSWADMTGSWRSPMNVALLVRRMLESAGQTLPAETHWLFAPSTWPLPAQLAIRPSVTESDDEIDESDSFAAASVEAVVAAAASSWSSTRLATAAISALSESASVFPSQSPLTATVCA